MVSFFQLKSQKFDELYELHRRIKSKKSWNEIDLQATIEACLELFNSEFDPNEINEEGTILLNIIGTERLDWVKFLVETGADVNLDHDEWGYPLEIAARSTSKEIYNYLEPLTHPEIKNYIFITSTVNHDYQTLQVLIDSGIDVDSPREYENGRTPLIIAVQQGNDKIVKMFLEAGANPNLRDEDSGTTPLISAIKRQYIYMTRLLLENGADINISDQNGYTALEIAMKLQNKKELSHKKKLRNKKIIDLLIDVSATQN